MIFFIILIKGIEVARWSDLIFAQTIKGIKKSENVPEDVKDPLTEANLKVMFKSVSLKSVSDVLIWIVIVFLFRMLLRVGQAVVSPHTLRSGHAKFFE